MALRVREGWQVKHNGKMHKGGDTLENVREADKQKWLGGGYVEEFDDKPAESKPAAKKTTSKGDS